VGGGEMSWKNSSFGRMFWWHKRKVVKTTVGWRRDPIYKKDGQKQVKGKTQSGNVEYSREVKRKK